MPWLVPACFAVAQCCLPAVQRCPAMLPARSAGDYIRFAVWAGAMAAWYCLYSLPMSFLHHYDTDWKGREELK